MEHVWFSIPRYKVDLDEVKHLFIRDLPKQIILKIRIWVLRVEMDGLPKTRKLPGLHVEPLRGNRSGQRSVRLSRAYRLIYIEDQNHLTVTVKVIEVNKHEY